MRTQNQIEASRINGARSSGPVTEEGKAISSRNAEKHGIFSDILLEGEDLDRFLAVLDRIKREHHPVTETEHDMTENMAVARWNQMRMWGIHAEVLNIHQNEKTAACPGFADLRNLTKAAHVFSDLAKDNPAIQHAHRYSNQYDRQYARSLKILKESQAAAAKKNCGTNLSYE